MIYRNKSKNYKWNLEISNNKNLRIKLTRLKTIIKIKNMSFIKLIISHKIKYKFNFKGSMEVLKRDKLSHKKKFKL